MMTIYTSKNVYSYSKTIQSKKLESRNIPGFFSKRVESKVSNVSSKKSNPKTKNKLR